MADWIGYVDAGAENCHRIPALFERSAMGSGVDAASHSTDDRDSGPHQGSGESPCCSLAVPRAVARSNDRDSWLGER